MRQRRRNRIALLLAALAGLVIPLGLALALLPGRGGAPHDGAPPEGVVGLPSGAAYELPAGPAGVGGWAASGSAFVDAESGIVFAHGEGGEVASALGLPPDLLVPHATVPPSGAPDGRPGGRGRAPARGTSAPGPVVLAVGPAGAPGGNGGDPGGNPAGGPGGNPAGGPGGNPGGGPGGNPAGGPGGNPGGGPGGNPGGGPGNAEGDGPFVPQVGPQAPGDEGELPLEAPETTVLPAAAQEEVLTVPEPGALALVLTALAGLGLARRMRQR